MKFIPLNRSFLPLKGKEAVSAEEVEAWGRRAFGVKTWPELLALSRVVVLAEANSGKTKEFEYQVKVLREQDKAAFFAPIEAIAGAGLLTIPTSARAARPKVGL